MFVAMIERCVSKHDSNSQLQTSVLNPNWIPSPYGVVLFGMNWEIVSQYLF